MDYVIDEEGILDAALRWDSFMEIHIQLKTLRIPGTF